MHNCGPVERQSMAFACVSRCPAPGGTYQDAILSCEISASAFPERIKPNRLCRTLSSAAKMADGRRIFARTKSHSSNYPKGCLVRAAYGGNNGVSKSLKSRLADGEKLYGIFLLSFSPVVAEIVGYAGYDYAVVDLEHGPGDMMTALPVLQVLASTNTPAIIRLPASDPVWAKKAMDLGPQGLMFPMIDSPKAAKRAVSYCRYPPKGIRGAAHPVVRASRYGMNAGYLESYENEVLIMCQVESEDAVERIEEIAMVDGVDCIQMGPTDLSANMGYLSNPGHKKAKEVLQKAERDVLSLKHGARLAGFAMPDDPPSEMQKRGYHMVAGAVDIGLLRDAAIADVGKHRIVASETGGIVSPSDVSKDEETGVGEKESEKEYV